MTFKPHCWLNRRALQAGYSVCGPPVFQEQDGQVREVGVRRAGCSYQKERYKQKPKGVRELILKWELRGNRRDLGWKGEERQWAGTRKVSPLRLFSLILTTASCRLHFCIQATSPVVTLDA